MEKLSRAFCLIQNSSSNNKSCKKNKEIIISETLEESLQNWKLPPFSASDVYKRSGILNSSPIKTVEEEIPLSEGYTTVPLFSDDLKRAYPKKFESLHIGMIRVGLKPTKLGSNTSAVICLRSKISRKFHESVYAMVESSLSDGPIYFSYFPPPDSDYVSLSKDLCNALCIDVKIEGDESMILMYRLHYRVLDRHCNPRARELSRYCVGERFNGETTLFFTTSVAQSYRALSKKMCWDEVAAPERWMEWKECADVHQLQVNVPAGLKREEIRVRVEAGRIVRISGERGEEKEEDTWRVLKPVKECVFLRRLRLPENGRTEEVKAVMENGVLMVMLPKEVVNEEMEENGGSYLWLAKYVECLICFSSRLIRLRGFFFLLKNIILWRYALKNIVDLYVFDCL